MIVARLIFGRGDFKPLLPLLLLALGTTVHAGSRNSANYAVTTETAVSGGARTTSANYTSHGSLGGVHGISSVTSPSETARQGYIAQLYEVTALTIAASPATVNEGATRQLNGAQLLDDATTIAVAPGSISWSVQSGPVTGISAGGLATAGTVFQDTAATVQGSYAGNSGILGLTVLNVSLDDYGTYASDGIDDSWQVQYFGQNNPNAAPDKDPDGDSQDNLLEFTAGVVPTDSLSKFTVTTLPVSGQPLQRDVMFSPTFVDRNYTVKFSTDLANWSTLSGPSPGTGSAVTITDTGAGDRRFYQVHVTKP